ncbi:MAG: ankyrin repeat domain-containing protein [Spirochaetes bacterium]|nr:MAG: ankyrin repeat domain-containing protein [Spirochaetota bacterium]
MDRALFRSLTRLIIIAMLSLCVACGGTAEQKKYREEIRLMGIDFDAYELFDRIDKGDRKTVELFLNAGFDADDRFPKRRGVGKSEMTPLLYASSRGMLEMVKLFVEKGANVNARGPMFRGKGLTPLMLASNHGYLGIAQYLLENKADVNMRVSPNGKTALIYACENGRADIAEELLKHGADTSARITGDGTTGSELYSEGMTALMLAVNDGKSKIVELLIGHKADLNVRRKYDGMTALMLAVGQGNPGLVKLLVDNGADMNIKNNDGETALGLAKKQKRKEIERILE